MCCRLPEPRSSALDTCCPCFISSGPCATASRHPTIRGMRPDSNGKQLLHRRPLTSTKNPFGPGKLTTTRSWTRLTRRKCPLQNNANASSLTAVHDRHGEAHAAHNPALLHHFAEPQQQRDAASLGMWVFLATEVMFFGGLFCAYLVYRRWYFGDFAAASKSINMGLGATNTAVLICSSLDRKSVV